MALAIDEIRWMDRPVPLWAFAGEDFIPHPLDPHEQSRRQFACLLSAFNLARDGVVWHAGVVFFFSCSGDLLCFC